MSLVLILRFIRSEYKQTRMDQLSVQSLFTEEAKAEAEKFMFSKLNFAGTGGVSVKEFANVSFHGIYGLTRARYL